MEAGKKNVTEIFNRSTILKVPHFQRAYVWKEEQWERFLDDMLYASNQNNPYFMGAIILKQLDTQVGEGDIRTIIDGQQRLTTIMLFFKALFELNNTPEIFLNTFITFGNDLIMVHNHADRSCFEKILLNKQNELTISDKEKRVFECYQYFKNHIVPDRMNYINLFANLMFVGIALHGTDDEQQIFDTINSLGVSLTTAELLKNYLFNEDAEDYNKNWREVFEKDDDTMKYWDRIVTSGRNKRSNIDLFLQAYLYIRIQDGSLGVISDDKIRFAKVESVFNSYKELISKYKVDRKNLVTELKEYAAIYRNVINPLITDSDINKSNYIQRLNIVMFGLDTTTIIPYVLYVSKHVSDTSERNSIYGYLEAYLVRRMICHLTAKNYNQLFSESMINKEIDTLKKLKDIIEKKSDKINYMPSDNDVKRGINESFLTNVQARGVLYLIEKTVRSENQATELKPFDEYSVEHVLPQKWRNHWDSDNMTEENKEERDRILYTLGNLTLITKKLNSSISNADWKTKKIGKGNKKGLLEYAQGIEIFSKYLQNESWSETEIKQRAAELYSHAVGTVWNIGQHEKAGLSVEQSAHIDIPKDETEEEDISSLPGLNDKTRPVFDKIMADIKEMGSDLYFRIRADGLLKISREDKKKTFAWISSDKYLSDEKSGNAIKIWLVPLDTTPPNWVEQTTKKGEPWDWQFYLSDSNYDECLALIKEAYEQIHG